MEKSYNYIDLSYLKSSSQDIKFIRMMVGLFKAEVPKLKEVLLNSLEEKNWDAFSKVAHKSKSTVAIVGIHELQTHFFELEKDAKNSVKTETYEERVKYAIEICELAVKELNEAEKDL